MKSANIQAVLLSSLVVGLFMPVTQADMPDRSEILALHSVAYGQDPAPEMKAFSIESIGWGIGPMTEPEILGWATDWIAQHKKLGLTYQTVMNLTLSNGYLTGPHPELLDSRSVDLWGRVLPLRRDGVLGEINGQPTWFHCINHPDWHNMMRKHIVYNLNAGSDGFEFDGPMASAEVEAVQLGLCFCDHCDKAFRAYVDSGNAPQAKNLLNKIEGGDYRAAFRKDIPQDKNPMEVVATIPLLKHYFRFQAQQSADLVDELVTLAEDHAGRDLRTSVNAYDLDAETLRLIPHVSYVQAEISHYPSSWSEGISVSRSLHWRYRLMDAFEKRLATTCTLWEWRWMQENRATNLVKLLLATAYANGHVYAVPNNYQWSGLPYQSQPEEFRPFIDFIKQHADKLDGHENIARVAVVYSPEHHSRFAPRPAHVTDYYNIVEHLSRNHISYRIILADNAMGIPSQVSEQQMQGIELIVVPGNNDLKLSLPSQSVPVRLANRKLDWAQDLQPDIKTDAAIWPQLRGAPGDDKAPVLHLVNGKFDFSSDKPVRQNNFKLSIRKATLSPASVTQATYYQPGQPEPVVLKFTESDGYLHTTIPQLTYWGMLAF